LRCSFRLMPWKKLLAWTTGQIDEVPRQQLEFVLAEIRIYRALLDRHSPHSQPRRFVAWSSWPRLRMPSYVPCPPSLLFDLAHSPSSAPAPISFG
jgi:hypothetical protein